MLYMTGGPSTASCPWHYEEVSVRASAGTYMLMVMQIVQDVPDETLSLDGRCITQRRLTLVLQSWCKFHQIWKYDCVLYLKDP